MRDYQTRRVTSPVQNFVTHYSQVSKNLFHIITFVYFQLLVIGNYNYHVILKHQTRFLDGTIQLILQRLKLRDIADEIDLPLFFVTLRCVRSICLHCLFFSSPVLTLSGSSHALFDN